MPEKFQDLSKRWLKAKRSELLAGTRVDREQVADEPAKTQVDPGDQTPNQVAPEPAPAYPRPDDDQAERAAAERAAADRAAAERAAAERAAAERAAAEQAAVQRAAAERAAAERAAAEQAAAEQAAAERVAAERAAAERAAAEQAAVDRAAATAERAEAVAERERAEIRALPRCPVDISIIGPWGGASWRGELSTRAERIRDDTTGEVTLRIAVETPDEFAPQIAGQPFYALRVELHPYRGPDRYNPARLRPELDPMDYTVEYAYRDETFVWVPDLGPGMLEITPGEEELDIGMPMQGAAGELRVTATITLPPIRDPQAEEADAADEQRRAFFATLPKAAVQLAVSGAAVGSWSGEVAAIVNRDNVNDSGARTLLVALAPVDADTHVAGLPFVGLRVEVPHYTGPGHYDLAAHSNELGAESNVLALGDEDEPFCWAPHVGPGTIAVGPDERSINVLLALRGPHGDLQFTATIALPEA